ncbi:NAD(P)-dependent oxidoreductase [Cryobacterium sp. Y82]|uniref:NAD-dependent epimerase/dehydratase family protein n=1 Tax=Cryobacterium sp. Y82 TaxID=2045017 RepID=UPI0018ECD859|nr:NAD(P)-dependent oxidoreductase [Cryobacterium sp. Y82]
MAKKILVTGAAGYIGRHVVKRLCDMGAEVTAVVRQRSGQSLKIDSRAELVEQDIFKIEGDPFALFGSPDVCLHLAWEAGFSHNSATHMLPYLSTTTF